MSKLSGVRNSALAGLIVLLPFAVVIYILNWLYSSTVSYLYPYVSSLSTFTGLDVLVTGVITSVFMVSVVLGLGYFVRSYIGYRIETRIDRLFEKVPVVGRIYDLVKSTSRDIVEQEKFNDPVKVETGDIRRTAFRTGKETDDGRKVLFMPTSPNITSGFVIEVRPEKIIEVEESSTEALERLVSAGFASKKEN